ncbi:MAG: hypothetical protein K2L42_04315 [Clostridia bacterium]|nr:hypothetical protein [Clostridia bacterium]
MKRHVIDWSVFVLSLGLTAFCCYIIYTEYGDMSLWLNIGLYIAFFASYILAAPVHELGHMLFGAFVKIKAVPKFSLRVKGSSSCKIIPKTDKNIKGGLIFTTCGGLAFNLVFIILGVVALCVPAVPSGLCVVLPASFYVFALNIIPFVTANGKTDGLVLLELIKNDDAAKVMLAVLTVQARVLNGKPIEQAGEALLFDVPQIQEDDESFIALTQLRYEYFAAKGDNEQAEKYKQRFEQLKNEYL